MSDETGEHSDTQLPQNETKYATGILYACYIILLIASAMILVIGILLEMYAEIIVSVPVIFILMDILFIDRMTANVPPLMIFMLFFLMICILVGTIFRGGTEWGFFVDLLFGIVLGLIGLILVYSLLRSMPGVRDESPFMVAFMSLAAALLIYVILTMTQFYLLSLSGNETQDSVTVMDGLLMAMIGATFVSILFYLNRHNGLFKYTVTKYLETNAGTIGIEEHELQEINKAIRNGESYKTEYKSTLRTNLATGEKDPRMEKAVLKTIVAFLNSDGGTLLIGVSDDGGISGIDEKSFDNRDRMNLHMTNLISSQIGNEFLPFISFRVVDVEGKGVMRVVCKKSNSPVFLKEGKTEIFYVRSGPSSVNLEGMDLLNYVSNRFRKKALKGKE